MQKRRQERAADTTIFLLHTEVVFGAAVLRLEILPELYECMKTKEEHFGFIMVLCVGTVVQVLRCRRGTRS